MGKNVGKNITKNLSSKHSQKPLDHAKESATVALIANGIQKTTEATCDLIGNKIADKITKVHELHLIIFQKQLDVKHKVQRSIEKYQKKDIYLQKKHSKLLIT